MTDEEISAEHVNLSESIKALTNAPVTSKGQILKYARDTCIALVVLIALITAYVQSKNTTKAAKVLGQKQTCAALYQDAVDIANARTTTTLGEIVVIISTVPPGDLRKEQVQEIIRNLTMANAQAHEALDAKVHYNDSGRTLPCPIH